MPYIQVGGFSGREGDYNTFQASDFANSGNGAPPPELTGEGANFPAMPEVQNLSEHYFDDPKNVGRVYMDGLSNPDLRNTPGFDWAGVQSLYNRMSELNPGKSYYEWGNLPVDDQLKLYSQSLTVPDYLKADPDYQKLYDAQGKQITQGNYTPATSEQVTQTTDQNTQTQYRDPLTGFVAGALPIAGKGLSTLGMAAQGAQVGGVVGAVAGAGIGYGMASVDPNKTAEQQTWYEKMFKGIGDALNYGTSSVEGLLAYGTLSADAQRQQLAKGLAQADTNQDGQVTPEEQQQANKEAIYGKGTIWLSQLLFGTPEQKTQAIDRWDKLRAEGQAYYESSAAHGVVSVPSKAVSTLAAELAKNPVLAAGVHTDSSGVVWKDGQLAPASEQPRNLAGMVIPALHDAWVRRDEVWGFEEKNTYKAAVDTTKTGNTALDALNNLLIDPEVVKASQDIKTLMDQGYTADQAGQAVKQRYGMGGVLNDLAGQMILDPLNLVGIGQMAALEKLAQGNKIWEAAKGLQKVANFDAGITKLVGGGLERLGWVSRMLGDPEVARIGDNPTLARSLERSGDAVQALRNYGADIRAQGVDRAAKFGYVSRLIAGVDEAGNYTRFKKLNADPTAWQKVGDALVHGTKEARATEFLQHVQQGIVGDLANLDNADDIVTFYKQLSSMTPQEAVDAASAKMVSGWTDNVMAQSAPAAVKNNLNDLLVLRRAFDKARPKALMFEAIGRALGVDARRVISQVLRASDMDTQAAFEFWKSKLTALAATGDADATAALRLMTDGASLKTDAMKFKIGKNGAGIPLNLNEFKANAFNLMGKGIEKFAADYFGLKPNGMGWQTQNFIRKVQGMLLLGLNPAYVMNNTINNVVTLLWDGLFSMDSLINRKNYVNDFGMPILRLNEGGKLDSTVLQKIGNDFMNVGEGGQVMRQATRAKGALAKATQKISDVSDKVSVLATLSAEVEGMCREMGTITGLREAMPQIWNVESGAITSVKNVVMADGRNLGEVLDGIHPGLSTAIDQGAARGMNMDQIRTNIFGKIDNPILQDVVSADDAATLGAFPSIVDELNGRLHEAKTTQDYKDAFTQARLRLTEAMHADVKAKAEEWAVQAAQAVQGEGLHAVLDLMDTMGDQTVDHFIDHFQRMQDAAEEAHLLRDQGDPDAAAAVWRQARQEADARWTTVRDMQTAKMVGAARGLGAGDVTITRIKENMLELQKVWDDFWAESNQMRDRQSETQFVDRTYRNDAYNTMEKTLDRKFKAAARKEAKLRGQLDEVFADMLDGQFPGSRQQAVDWRKTVADSRELQVDAMTAFRTGDGFESLPGEIAAKIADILDGNEVKGMNVEAREVAWRRFIDEVYEPLLTQKEIEGRIKGREMMQSTPGADQLVTPEEKAAIRTAKLQAEQAMADAKASAGAPGADGEVPPAVENATPTRTAADIDRDIADLEAQAAEASANGSNVQMFYDQINFLDQERSRLAASANIEGVNDLHGLDEQIRIVQGNRDTLARDMANLEQEMKAAKRQGADYDAVSEMEASLNESKIQLSDYDSKLADLNKQHEDLITSKMTATEAYFHKRAQVEEQRHQASLRALEYDAYKGGTRMGSDAVHSEVYRFDSQLEQMRIEWAKNHPLDPETPPEFSTQQEVDSYNDVWVQDDLARRSLEMKKMRSRNDAHTFADYLDSRMQSGEVVTMSATTVRKTGDGRFEFIPSPGADQTHGGHSMTAGELAEVVLFENRKEINDWMTNHKASFESSHTYQEQPKAVLKRPEQRRPEGAALRQKIDTMSPDEKNATIAELRRQVTTSEKTGLPNGRAYHVADKKPAQLMVDVSGLKKVNDTWGHEAGDALLRGYGNLLYGVAGEDVYHISGDEFMIQAATPEAAQAIVDQIRAALNDFKVTVKDKTGREVMLEGFDAHTGIGDSMGAADAELNRIKAARPAVNGDARLNTRVHEVMGTGNAGEVPLSKTQTAQAARTMLSGFSDLHDRKTGQLLSDEVLVKAINKYTGKRYTAKHLAAGEVSLIDVQITMQRRAIAKALGYRGRTANNKLRDLEKRLGMDLSDYTPDNATPAVAAPLGATQRLQGLPPFEEAVLEGWTKNVLPTLRKAEKQLTSRPKTDYAAVMKTLPDDVRSALNDHMGTIQNDLTSAKQAALKVAQGRTDFALLNYNDRYGFDNIVSAVMPYQFWYTRSMRNWFLRSMTHPEILSRYAHVQSAAAAVPQDDLPSRVQGKIRIKLPFMPEEYGGEVFVDPMKQMFPMVQLIQPLIQMQNDNNMLNKRTESILQQKVQDGEISAEELGAGLKDHNSDAWKKAMAQAKMEVDVNIRNPTDFISSMSGFSLPLQWIYQGAIQQSPDRISQLPISKTVQNLSYLGGRALGMNITQGLNPETPVRSALGMPEDRYQKYAIDRTMASLSRETAAAGGKVTLLDGSQIVATSDDFNKQLVDRKGPLYDLALQRVSTMNVGKWIGSPVRPDVVQQGERQQRTLSDEYSAAMKSGDPDAYAKFQAAHPEYSTQKMAWSPEEDRVKTYMKNLVWATYMGLNPAIQQDVSNSLGPKFQQLFLAKDTRDYNQISSEELSQWAKTMDAKAPVANAVASTPGVSVKFASKDIVDKMGTYYEQYETQFPGLRDWFTKSGYYDKTQAEQDKLALDFPEISMYNKWRESYLANNPEIIQRMISETSPVYGLPQDVQQVYYLKRALRDTYFSGIYKAQAEYFSYPKGSAQRRQIAASNPQLNLYWTWSRSFDQAHSRETAVLNAHKALDPVGDSETIQAQGEDKNAWVSKAVQEMSPELSRRMLNYVAYNETPSSSAQAELDILRKQYQSGISLDEFMRVMRNEIKSRYITQ